MKLGVDVRWMVGNYRGMGRFARNLISNVSPSVIGLAPAGVTSDEWPVVSRGNNFFPWWEQQVLPSICRSEQLDYVLCPYNTGPLSSLGSTRSISVIHDLIFMQSWRALPPSASLYQSLGRLYRRQVVPAFAKRADVILTVSHFTKNELVEKFNLSPNSIRVIPNAIADGWFLPPVSAGYRQPYLFTVAGEAPSKNIHRLLSAFAVACSNSSFDATLKIAGVKSTFHPFFRKQALQLGIADRVEWLGFLSENELREQYRQARAFVFASLFEGFGIPLLEAMASGTPVVCSNTTSMPEVVGDYGVFFDPFSITDMAEKIQYIWLAGSKMFARTDAAIDHARGFSETSIAVQTKKFWSDIS